MRPKDETNRDTAELNPAIGETVESADETASSVTTAENPPVTPSAGANLFTIRRRPGIRIVTVVVIENGHTEPRSFDEKQSVFQVDRVTAIAAVESGGFEIAPESRARLKE